MNRILSILLLFISISIVSCSSDDDGSPAGDIIGMWEYHKVGGFSNGNEVLIPWEHECPNEKDKIEFRSDNTMRIYEYWDDCSQDFDQGTWSLNGNTLTTNVDGYIQESEIVTLTETTLRIKFDEANTDIALMEFKRR
ncbi:MAG: lipocalin family protein [Bacteroidetes bacterium]|jgi:hypothetical protein|nr:lipocalin family protein [Bacteroidota bacterium]